MSQHAIGAVLGQSDGDDLGAINPVTFWSWKFSVSECNYSKPDKELMVVSDSLAQFELLLWDTPVLVQICGDHCNLSSFLARKPVSTQLACITVELMLYNLVIKHVPGANNLAASDLSWRTDLGFTDEE